MDNLQFYSTDKPEFNENVLVHFIEMKDAYFKAKLIEYSSYEGILNFKDATKKKKIKSWTNIVSLNKNMVAKVEEIDDVKKIVKLSLIYLKNDILMVYFNENKIMEKLIKTFCIINKYDFNTIWTDIVYKIDIKRREVDNNLSLWIFFSNNKDLFNSTSSESNESNKIYNELIYLYSTKYENINQKVISKFGIISNIGIDVIKIIFNNILSNIKYDYILKYNIEPEYVLKYDAAPNYLFETILSKTNDNSIHNIFIDNLHKEINNYAISYEKPVIFIKIEYISKII